AGRGQPATVDDAVVVPGDDRVAARSQRQVGVIRAARRRYGLDGPEDAALGAGPNRKARGRAPDDHVGAVVGYREFGKTAVTDRDLLDRPERAVGQDLPSPD